MVNIYGVVKNQGGCSLRKTSKHDGRSQRFYASIEKLGITTFVRISKDTYVFLNEMAKVKCAFTTNIKKETVQYTHSISL